MPAAVQRRKERDEPFHKRRLNVYFQSIAQLDAFKKDAENTGLDYSQLALMLIESRKNMPTLFRVAQVMNPKAANLPIGGGEASANTAHIERERDEALARARRLEAELAEAQKEIAGLNATNDTLSAQLRAEQTRLSEYLAASLDRMQRGLQQGAYDADGTDEVINLVAGATRPMTEAAILNDLVRKHNFKTDSARLAFAQAVSSGRLVSEDGRFSVAPAESPPGKPAKTSSKRER